MTQILPSLWHNTSSIKLPSTTITTDQQETLMSFSRKNPTGLLMPMPLMTKKLKVKWEMKKMRLFQTLDLLLHQEFGSQTDTRTTNTTKVLTLFNSVLMSILKITSTHKISKKTTHIRLRTPSTKEVKIKMLWILLSNSMRLITTTQELKPDSLNTSEIICQINLGYKINEWCNHDKFWIRL